MVNVFLSGKVIGSLRGGTLLESLPVTTLKTVGVLGLKPILSFSLSFEEEEEDRTSGEGFLEAEKAETLLKEHLVIQQVWNLPLE